MLMSKPRPGNTTFFCNNLTLEIKTFILGSRIRDVEVGGLKNNNFLPLHFFIDFSGIQTHCKWKRLPARRHVRNISIKNPVKAFADSHKATKDIKKFVKAASEVKELVKVAADVMQTKLCEKTETSELIFMSEFFL